MDSTEVLVKILAEQQTHKAKLDHIITQLMIANLGPERIFSFTSFGIPIQMYLPHAAVDWTQSKILRSSNFLDIAQLEKLKPYVRPGMHVVDVGANIGNHSVFFSKVCRAASINAFEPQQSVREILEKNVQLNNCKDVTIHPYALGEKSTKATVTSFRANNTGATTIGPDRDGEIKMVKLDDVDIPRVDFLKVDIEGGQLPFLKGALRTIRRNKPLIFIEMLSERNEFPEANEAITSLRYTRTEIDKDNHLYTPS